jgi:hypothetical protein
MLSRYELDRTDFEVHSVVTFTAAVLNLQVL